MAPTPSSTKSHHHHQTLTRTPQSRHRLQFPKPQTTPNPNNNNNPSLSGHPIEVLARIRDYPDSKDPPVLQINPEKQSIRVRADFGYRDFTLDGVSVSESDDLGEFYAQFVKSRIDSVKLGEKCTVMMYGPTGSGKSHTMFGCVKQPGIVYRSLKDILGNEEDDEGVVGRFVQVTVLEIYNEEIYDLLSGNGAAGGGGGFGFGWPKGNGSSSKVRLEVMGKKAKNATYISGNEAGKISKEIQKVEKRRIVKSTLCNERSSRSHCMIILDVPTVGGRLMLVDMAGSENIEQAGQLGFEAKMQTGKINQGNIALKRVVESIANGDSHVPFRDSKLTMLLQDSFEDDKTKILMVLCASPDPKEIHKTIATLEYGAKAKCIVRGPHTPIKDKAAMDDSSAVILGSRIAAMDEFILKLQKENKIKEKERNDAHKLLLKKEEEVAAMRTKLQSMEGKGSGSKEEEFNLKVNEVAQTLKQELERKLEECQRMANEFVELERRRMEERIWQQQQEVEMLRKRLEEIELELCRSGDGSGVESGRKDNDGTQFAKRLMGIYASDGAGMMKSMDMVKSMDLDMDDQEPFAGVVKYVGINCGVTGTYQSDSKSNQGFANQTHLNAIATDNNDSFAAKCADRVCLSTVFEEEEMEEEERKENVDVEEVEKEVIEEKRVCMVDGSSHTSNYSLGSLVALPHDNQPSRNAGEEDSKGGPDDRLVRIRNIFTLCGNYRELSQHITSPAPTLKPLASFKSESEKKVTELDVASKENYNPSNDGTEADSEVYVKWEASKENPGKFITTLRVVKDATLADLRKLIEIYLGADNQAFNFLVLGDPTGAAVPREKEATIQATKLPLCNGETNGYLACLRPLKGTQKIHSSPVQQLPLTPLPLSSLENRLPVTPTTCFTPQVEPSLGSTPFITVRKC
ncbi:kinesin-like protein KIN-10A [Argentina anserina]|uniref:kinesin-like protein KIN-10A n=1 Tax=Argentina anserina TaxID=57926 RepID=UPI0021766CB2|nr:kinesin-like protein KIN-10A [Potentilla anserina]